MRKVTLDNTILDALTADPAGSVVFAGCLGPLAAAPKKAGCGACGTKARAAAEAYNEAKLCLARMADEKRAELKRLLHADQVVIYAASGGRTSAYQF